MSKYEVVPYRYYKRDDGKTASIHGASPWVSDAEKARWNMVEGGYTVYNPFTGQYGIGRMPWPTQGEAQAWADKNKPSRIAIGD